jgi:hypothetical protein
VFYKDYDIIPYASTSSSGVACLSSFSLDNHWQSDTGIPLWDTWLLPLQVSYQENCTVLIYLVVYSLSLYDI